MSIKLRKGQLLVEILVAIGISSILIPVVYAALITSREGRVQEESRLEASVYLRECQEALKSVREISWNNLPTPGTYYPLLLGPTYTFPAGSETIATRFTRSVLIEAVQRDSGGAIVSSGGTVDPSTIKATCSVSWTGPIASSISSVAYLTRYLSNTYWEVTTTAAFDTGTFVSTESQGALDGEVVLSTSPGGSWATPSLLGTYDHIGNTNSMHVISDGAYAYVARDGNPSVLIVDVTTPATPVLTGSVIITGTVAEIMLSGNYLYAATSNNTREFVIVDVTNKASPAVAGDANLSGNSDAFTVYYDANYAYVGRSGGAGGDPEFAIINVSAPASPVISSQLEIGYTINRVVVSGNYAFLGTNNGSNKVYVINITNKASPTIVSNYNLPGTSQINSMAFTGSSLYVGTDNNASGQEFYVLNISNPLSISTSGIFETGVTINDVTLSGTNAYIVVNSTTDTFRTLDVTNPASISQVGAFSLIGTATGVSVSGSYAYVSNTDNAEELQIIGGGSGGGYELSGTYESDTFDAGASVSYNYLTFNVNEPSATDVQIQVAVNDTGSGWSFVGPDGTSGTYYTGDGLINLLNTKGRYFRAKAYLTGDGTSTPELQSFRINYSP